MIYFYYNLYIIMYNNQQNRQYYNRGENLDKDEIYFKYYNETNHEGKYIIDKIEIKNKKKFIKQYKLYKQDLNDLIIQLQKRNIKILNLPTENIINNEINNKEQYNPKLSYITYNNPLDSYKGTIESKYFQK